MKQKVPHRMKEFIVGPFQIKNDKEGKWEDPPKPWTEYSDDCGDADWDDIEGLEDAETWIVKHWGEGFQSGNGFAVGSQKQSNNYFLKLVKPLKELGLKVVTNGSEIYVKIPEHYDANSMIKATRLLLQYHPDEIDLSLKKNVFRMWWD